MPSINKLYPILLTFIMLSVPRLAMSQYEDNDDKNIRENPEITQADSIDCDIEIPAYINRNKNCIITNGADWSRFSRRTVAPDTTVSIVHIGDSHIQADFATGHARDMLQQLYGNPGRGLITPLKMAGTNEPRDYAITSQSRWLSSKLLKKPWASPMRFTGVSITPKSKKCDLTIATLTKNEPEKPFNNVKILHLGKLEISRASVAGQPIECDIEYGDGSATINIPREVTEITVEMTKEDYLSIFGIVLANTKSEGVYYHTIGNNGATYSTYNAVDGMGADVARLDPDLVIISLGANEAFGKLSISNITDNIDLLVNDIRRHNKDATILLVTPMECQRSRIIRTKKGRRRSRNYSVNANILPIRNAILEYGRKHNISVYDWYDIAGGQGASTKWVKDKLMGGDRIHNTREGYRLQGQLLYEAINDAIINNAKL